MEIADGFHCFSLFVSGNQRLHHLIKSPTSGNRYHRLQDKQRVLKEAKEVNRPKNLYKILSPSKF